MIPKTPRLIIQIALLRTIFNKLIPTPIINPNITRNNILISPSKFIFSSSPFSSLQAVSSKEKLPFPL